MTTDKLINTIEKDPPTRETKAPNVIGAIKPPSGGSSIDNPNG